MPIYPFRCLECGAEEELIQSIKVDLVPPTHCNESMEQVLGNVGFVLGRTPGKASGFYDLDYGKRATEDLTVPGKMEQLKKDGRIKDPFDSVAPNSSEQAIQASREFNE
jgi:putative FmdB family regulatory protein